MSRWMLVIAMVAIGASQSAVMAGFCPTNNPGEILCEDFDTYCAASEYPGGAGVTKGAQCPADATLTPPTEDDYMRIVWPASSSCYPCDASTTPCTSRTDLPIPLMFLDNLKVPDPNLLDYYPYSRPFGARVKAITVDGYAKGSLSDPIPQHTFKDWSTGESNISRFTANAFNDTKFKAVYATDLEPLVLTFMLDSATKGGIYYGNGYIELGFGDPADPLNRANTDYAYSEYLHIACNTITFPHVRFPVICDVLNPIGAVRYVGCPDPTNPLTPPTKRNAIAIGVLAMTDVDNASVGPVHCLGAKGGQSSHPKFFNGEGWYDLHANSPATSSVSVTDMSGNPIDPSTLTWTQPDVVTNSFTTWQDNPVAVNCGTHNWLTLTIKSNTAKVTLFKIVPDSTDTVYKVTNTMDNIPLAYSGPFDSIRIGVGPGCQLASNSSWDCAAGSTRGCLATMAPQSKYMEFDDISLYGGKGWNAAGACCKSGTGICEDNKLPSECESPDTHMGGSTWCDQLGETGGVYCCPIPYADTDGDLDVDAADFGKLQTCYSGDLPAKGNCNCFDRNGDGKVNQVDVGTFAACATGPGIMLPGECP